VPTLEVPTSKTLRLLKRISAMPWLTKRPGGPQILSPKQQASRSEVVEMPGNDVVCHPDSANMHYQLGNERTGWSLPAHTQVGGPGGLSVSTREAWLLTDPSGT